MNVGLKSLIAVTCVVVIAGIGFWTWRAVSGDAEQRAIADQAALRDDCRQLADRLPTQDIAMLERCLTAGLIKANEVMRHPEGVEMINAVNAQRKS